MRAEGGRRVYGDTDSCIATGLSPEAVLRVQRRFERLNIYGVGGPRIVPGPDGRLRMYPHHRDGALLLRVQPEAWSDEPLLDKDGASYFEQVTVTFVGWHSKRTALLDPGGRARMYSEAGLGSLLDPRNPEPDSDTSWIAEALEHVAGTRPEPDWVGAWSLATIPANAAEVSRLYTGRASGRIVLRPWEPLALAYQEVTFGKGRVFAAPWRPGFHPPRTLWRVFGSGERVRVRAHEERDRELEPSSRDGGAEARTMRDELRRYPLLAERGTLGPDGKPCRRANVGRLVPRPVAASRLRRIGRESHSIEEALTGQRTPIVAFPAERRGSRSPADQAFRDALKVLRRERDAGGDLDVRDARRRRIPRAVVDDALLRRAAPSKIRAAIIAAAARAVSPTPDRKALALAVTRCGWCGTPIPSGRRRWCGDSCKFRAFRARQKEAAP